MSVAGCSEPQAPTDPHGFPDLSGFTVAASSDYLRHAPSFNGLAFQTPDGLSCSHNGFNSMLDPSTITLTCTGPVAAQGPGSWRVIVSTKHEAVIAPATEPGVPGRELPAGSALEYQGIECGVDDGVTACRVGEHGFVLTPDEVRRY